MKRRFELVYRLGLCLLLVIALWAVWVHAQNAGTNAPGPAPAPDAGRMHQPTNEFSALSFGLDKVDFLSRHSPLGQPLWKYGASLIYIFLAFFVAWLLDFVVAVWLRRLASKNKPPQDDVLLKLLRGPIKIVAFVILVNIGLGVFDWPARAQLVLSRGLIVVVACSVAYLAINLAQFLLGLWRDRIVTEKDRVFAALLFPLLSNLCRIGIILTAAVLTAENLGININSLIAGLSVGGLALGLAAQDTVANLFGALAIFLDKPFYPGDVIRVEGCEGAVEAIGLRSTRIRNADGYCVMIPNKTMGNAVITNITRRPTIRTEMNLKLTHDTTVEKVQRATAILDELFRSHPKTASVLVSFNKFTDSALNIYIEHVWQGVDCAEQMAQLQRWNLQIKQRFEAEKIQFAFPTQTVQLKTEAAK